MQTLENKIPPPIITVIFAVVMWGVSFAGLTIELSGVIRGITILVLLISSAFFSMTGMQTFKRAATTINPLKPEEASSLVSSGIYQISRNPMYVGLALILLAWAVYLSSAWAFVGVLGFILYMNRFQITPEERALKDIFGSKFEDYRSNVRRWL